jgi:hypothetical protein
MYSSGGDLHLELPEGGLEADTAAWQIPPYHTKPVMRATFLARAESNHTAYIRCLALLATFAGLICQMVNGRRQTSRCPCAEGPTRAARRLHCLINTVLHAALL